MTEGELTRLLNNWANGDESALEELIPLVYEELKRRAKAFMAKERTRQHGRDHTLQTAGLVNEVYLRLRDLKNVHWNDSEQFFRFSAILMRQVLIKYARERRSRKRGGGLPHLMFDEIMELSLNQDTDPIDIYAALNKLDKLYPRAYKTVSLHYLFGFTIAQTAKTLQVSVGTVKNDMIFAKTWLRRELGKGE